MHSQSKHILGAFIGGRSITWRRIWRADRGFVVFTFDRRGFGRTALDPKKSQGIVYGRMVLGDTDQIPDIAWALSVAQEANPTVPLFLMGHSMDSVSQLSGIIATSPCLRLAKPLASIVRWLGSRVHAILPNQNIPASVEPKYLSHDPAVVKENEMDTRRSASLRAVDDMLTRVLIVPGTEDMDWHAYELVPFLLLGVFGGVYGAYFSKLNYRWSRDVRNKTWLKNHPIAEVLLITAITTILNFVNGYTLMGGTELVYNLFAVCLLGSPNTHAGLCVLDPGKQTFHVMRMIAVALVVKAALTVVTFGIKVPAGIFIPTLGVGACAGRIVGLVVQYARWRWPTAPVFASCLEDSPCVIPGLYAMVGAAAALSGVTRTTVSLAVIMFELTDTLTYAVPVMLAVLVAKTVADALEPKGIYDLVIELSQLPYLNAKHQYLWGGLTVSDAMDRDVEAIHFGHSNTATDIGFPILRSDEDGRSRMLGFIGGNELEHALSIVAEEADHPVSFHPSRHLYRSLSSSSLSSILEHPEDPFDFSVYMDKTPLTISINSPLELIQQFFWQFALVSWEGWP
ncbi:chloride channel [Lactifluus subvellereus]|nr:chloride channel [Lactifluus subvellereus]